MNFSFVFVGNERIGVGYAPLVPSGENKFGVVFMLVTRPALSLLTPSALCAVLLTESGALLLLIDELP